MKEQIEALKRAMLEEIQRGNYVLDSMLGDTVIRVYELGSDQLWYNTNGSVSYVVVTPLPESIVKEINKQIADKEIARLEEQIKKLRG